MCIRVYDILIGSKWLGQAIINTRTPLQSQPNRAFGGDFEEAEALVFGEGGGLQGDGAGKGVVFLALWRGGFGVVHGGADMGEGPALAGGIHAQGLVGAGA